MSEFVELFAWVYRGESSLSNPLAELFERSIPLSALVLASLCGILVILFRSSSLNRCVQALMACLALIGVGFFVIRMVGYYSFSSSTDFNDLILGISFTWQATALFFLGIAIAMSSVLVARVVEKRSLARQV